MATESLVGGALDQITDDIQNLLNKFTIDSVDTGIIAIPYLDHGKLVIGTNTLVTSQEIKDFFQNRIDSELPPDSPDPSITALNISLTKALDNLLNDSSSLFGLNGIIKFSGENATNAESSASDGAADQTILFEITPEAVNNIFALLLNEINDEVNSDVTIELRGIEKALLVGSGRVKVGDDSDVNLQGDNRDQHITGGSGNDTLVGGGGNDTLVGGGGDDIIGFNALGHYTVLIDNGDKLAFQFDGINTLGDLLPFVTGASEADGNVTFEFLDGEASITLVGMSANDVTADMVLFNLS